MKRHVQTPGVRRWWGEDFLELQSESLEVLDNFFAQYGSCVIKGCDVNGNNISSGIVALSGFDPDSNSVFKVARFAGAQNVSSFPAYLTLRCDVENRLYADQQQHPAVYNYHAELKTTLPTVPHIVITADGGQQFVDAIQDQEHRMITDVERTNWNGKASRIQVNKALIEGIPVGVVQAFAGTKIPSGWRLCDGSSLSKSEYAHLYAVMGDTFGSTTTMFKIPDLRGEFIRGHSSGRYISSEGYIDQGRSFGSTQVDALQNITGRVETVAHGTTAGMGAKGAFTTADNGNKGNAMGPGQTDTIIFDASLVARTSTETRPHNVALNYIIRVRNNELTV